MKKSSKILILAIFLIMICCVSAASAAEIENSTADSVSVSNEAIGEVDESNDENTLTSANDVGVDDKLMDGESGEGSSSNTKVIYVGHNNVTEGGDGSHDNPFSTFKAACDNVSGEDNVTIYVFEGTYKIGEGMVENSGTSLKFNTSNLNIIGIGSVTIINKWNNNKGKNAEAFSLVSDSANFTFSNLIFDATGYTQRYKSNNYFAPFYGTANLGIYKNCSFILGGGFLFDYSFDTMYIGCSFKNNNDVELFYRSINANITFKNCIFGYRTSSIAKYQLPFEVLMDDVWFGQNTLPSYLHPSKTQVHDENLDDVEGYVVPVTRYAIFTVTQNYLGNDEYEIIGKLTWNGTDDQDGMENFQPMTVLLESENGGEIASSVPLVNGIFKTTYKNSASNHKITATLHNQDIDLVFTKVNITADEASIKYGEDQNITVNLSQAIDNNVTFKYYFY